MQEKVIVLRSTAGNLLTGRRVTQLASASDVHRMNFQYMGENEVSEEYVYYTFLDPEQGAEFVLVDDYLEDIAYVSLQNVPEYAIETMKQWLSEHIGLFTPEEVQAALTEDLEGNASLLTHLGLMEDRETPDARTVTLVKRALNSSVTETVERALVAAQLLGWPELHQAVQALSKQSPDPHLREFARKVVVQPNAALTSHRTLNLMEVFRNRAPLNLRIRPVGRQAVDKGETRQPVSSLRLTSFKLLAFEARLVSAAIESADGLYVRTTDDVLSVDPNGQVARIHTLDEQSSFGFKGLALHQGALWTFDQSLVGESVLTAISPDGGEVRVYGDVPFRRPDALVVVDGELLVLDRLVPTTEISLFQNGQKRLVGEARNLTHWLVRDDALLWSENEGIWQWQAGRVTQLVKHPGILTFDRSLNFVAQLPAGDENAMTVNAEGTALPVKTGQGPVALHTLSSGSLVQFAKELAPLHTPQDRQAFPGREELGPVLNPQDQVVFLSGSRQLASSSDGRTWLHTELPVKCTRLVQAGPCGFIGSSRQGSVWVRFVD